LGCYPREASVIKSRNADVEAVVVSAVEGKPMYGGNMLVKPLIKGDEMTFLEIHYAAGVGASHLCKANSRNDPSASLTM
jgi:hypothetical protein